MPNNAISIIISTYNWPAALGMILDALLQEIKCSQYDIEIIIADDGSTDATANLIANYQKKYNQIYHIWQPDQGFRKAAILNKAVASAHGKYLIFLDGDCIPFPKYTESHLKLSTPRKCVAGHRVLLSQSFTQSILHKNNADEILQWKWYNWISAYLTGKVNKCFSYLRIKFLQKYWRNYRCNNWLYPKGCNFSLYREDFLLVGGFDEKFEGWGHEDSALFLKLTQANIKMLNGKFATEVLHLWHATCSREHSNKNWQKILQDAL
jgi:glycosyltransferase involved in cell wall biosynthesis